MSSLLGNNFQTTPIAGPLGFWNFPMLNALRQRLLARQMFRTSLTQQFMAPHPREEQQTRETLKNAEKWQILRDDRGRMIALEIHRTVEEAQ